MKGEIWIPGNVARNLCLPNAAVEVETGPVDIDLGLLVETVEIGGLKAIEAMEVRADHRPHMEILSDLLKIKIPAAITIAHH